VAVKPRSRPAFWQSDVTQQVVVEVACCVADCGFLHAVPQSSNDVHCLVLLIFLKRLALLRLRLFSE
jgi:hypothetical protein